MSEPTVEATSRPSTKTARRRIQHWAIFSAVVAVLLLQGTGTFRYDAQHYWLGANGIVNGTGAPDGFFELRGVLTAMVFTPAALFARFFGEPSAGFFVLLQNSLVIAWLGTHVTPSIMTLHTQSATRIKIFTASSVALVGSGFAPYPLVDIYAALFCILGATLLIKRQPHHLVLAGLCIGIAVNIRPAYLIAAGLILVATIPWNNWKTLHFMLGITVAQAPQMVVNLIKFDTLRPTPTATDDLIGLQASYASYVVRYDTLLGASVPQQFYCSPGMAVRVVGQEPTTTSELATTFIQNTPESLLFSLQKFSAALHWPLRTPYSVPHWGLDTAFAIAIAALTVVGVCAIIRKASEEQKLRQGQGHHSNLLLLAMALGTTLTLVASATESRFALLLVLVGIIGCAQMLEELFESPPRRSARAFFAPGIAFMVVVPLGFWGLSHPLAAGGATAALCSAS